MSLVVGEDGLVLERNGVGCSGARLGFMGGARITVDTGEAVLSGVICSGIITTRQRPRALATGISEAIR